MGATVLMVFEHCSQLVLFLKSICSFHNWLVFSWVSYVSSMYCLLHLSVYHQFTYMFNYNILSVI